MSKDVKLKTTEIEKNVMGKIKNGEAKMKPRSYYMTVGFLGALTVLLLGSITAYSMSIATLWLRLEAAQGPAYGVRNNLSNMWELFPWWALVIGLMSLMCMIFLVKKIGSLYKIRLIYLIPSIMILLIVIGYLLSYSSLPGIFNGQKHNTSCLTGAVGCQPSDIRNYHNE